MPIVDIIISLKVRGEPTAGKCVVCGCTEERPCPKGCGWTDPSELLCSACLDRRVLSPYWLGLITVTPRQEAPPPPPPRILPVEVGYYWRARGARLWHRELRGNRMVCGLQATARREGTESVQSTKPPGQLCANCERMQDAESVRPLLRKERPNVQGPKREAREDPSRRDQARR